MNHTASTHNGSGSDISTVTSGGSSRVSGHSGAMVIVSSDDMEGGSDNEMKNPPSHYVSYKEER